MPSDQSTFGTHAQWPSTVWHLVADLDQPGHRELAAQVLATRYWRPVYAFLRRLGLDHHRASDRTQDFFLALFQKDWALRADPQRGRFRTFLITLLQRYVRDLEEKRQEAFERSQGAGGFSPSGDDRRLLDWSPAASADRAFWAQYVRDAMDRALAFLRSRTDETLTEEGRRTLSVFFRRVDGLALDSPPTWDELAREFGLTRDQARYAFRKGVQRFRHALARELGSEEAAGPDLDRTLRELRGELPF